jgi:hypothetical protein
VDGGDVAQVAISDGERGVPECVTDDVDRSAFASELRGVGVPEAVSVDPALNSRLARQARQQVADIGGIEVATGKRAEDRSAGGGGQQAPTVQPVGQ